MKELRDGRNIKNRLLDCKTYNITPKDNDERHQQTTEKT